MPEGGDMSIQKLLVPFNFTSYDQKTLDFVILHFDQIRREVIEPGIGAVD